MLIHINLNNNLMIFNKMLSNNEQRIRPSVMFNSVWCLLVWSLGWSDWLARGSA